VSTEPTPLPPPELSPAPAPAVPTYPPWSLWDVLAIALVAIGSIQILGLIGAVVAVRMFHLSLAGLDRNAKLAVPVEFLAYLITLGFMVAVVRSRGYRFWSSVRWEWTGGLIRYVAFGFLLAVGIGLGSAFLPIPKQLPIEQYFADTTGTWLLAIFGVTVAPFMEELFFRGFLYPALARPLGIAASVVITALTFALIHSSQLASAWAPLLLLFVVGVVLTLLRVRTGSVIPSFVLHAAYNLTLFVQTFFATDHFRHLEKLSG
jgi:uncharacterized protein